MALTTLMRNRITRHIEALYKEAEAAGTLAKSYEGYTIHQKVELLTWAEAAIAQHCTAKQAA